MRHFISPRAVAAISCRMLEAALTSLLVALRSGALRLASRALSTTTFAVDLATITMAAYDDLCATKRAKKHSGGIFHRHVRLSRRDVDEIPEQWDTRLAPVGNKGARHGIDAKLSRVRILSCLFSTAERLFTAGLIAVSSLPFLPVNDVSADGHR
jgi:hypothetical protein